jgi:hypothetical protein
MIQTFDTDTILFQLLKASTAVTTGLTGGIYVRRRPLNSTKEDIVINTITLSQEYEPQLGTSNINIHVSDVSRTIASVQQKVANNERMKAISSAVLEVVRKANIAGIGKTIENQTVIEESAISQHYVNIRINWFIH